MGFSVLQKSFYATETPQKSLSLLIVSYLSMFSSSFDNSFSFKKV